MFLPAKEETVLHRELKKRKKGKIKYFFKKPSVIYMPICRKKASKEVEHVMNESQELANIKAAFVFL